jgi:hypothetical protein
MFRVAPFHSEAGGFSHCGREFNIEPLDTFWICRSLKLLAQTLYFPFRPRLLVVDRITGGAEIHSFASDLPVMPV